MVKTVQIQEFGGPEQMHVVDVPVAPLQAGQVRIRQHAVGVNYIDVYHRTGLYPNELPLSLGMEAAGEVLEVGAGVLHLQVGDRVAYASGPVGSYTEERVITAQNVCRLPPEIAYETGAAMMLKGLTAQYLLKKCKPVEGLAAGDCVLFHAAAGGVGLIACQWAKLLGLRLIATAGSDEKCALALANGASYAINYRQDDFVQRVKDITSGQGVKVVYDSVGKDTWEGSLDCLQPFGLMVTFGNASGPVPAFAPAILAGKGSLYVTRQTLFAHLTSRERTQAMADDLFAVVASGAVKIHVEQRFALDDVQQAHRQLEARQTIGSTILLP